MTRFRAGAVTDKGRVRANNQDSQLVIDGRLFAIADGMGGHRGGEVASALALESLAETLHEASTSALRESLTVANEVVYSRASGDPELRGMGTTLTALALVTSGGRERLAVANVGDSRAYRLRGDQFEQMTEDHSLVESLVRQGRLTVEEAVTHPQRNIITRALGIDRKVEVDVWELAAVAGDRYLLCSDGLFNEVETNRIAATLRKLADPTDAAHELVRLANEGGGRDNITCVVVDVIDGPGSAAEEAQRVGTASEPDLGAYGPGPSTTPVPVTSSVFDDAPVAAETGRSSGGTPPDKGDGRGPAPLIGAIPDRLPDDDDGESGSPGTSTARRTRPRRITWRVVVFVLALVALSAAVAGALVYYGRNTYYVGLGAREQVTIFKGRPGGFLVFEPTAERVTDIRVADLRATDADRVRAESDQASLADAEAFVANLCDGGLKAGADPRECKGDAAATTNTSPATTTVGAP